MNDPLTPPERLAWEDALYDRPHDTKVLVATIARLVAEVERLHERSARLELRGDLHLVFATMPGPDGAEFVEAEDAHGNSVNCGEWRSRQDGLFELVVKSALAALNHPEAPDRTEAKT